MKALLRYVKLGVIVAISGIYATPAFADTQFPQELSKMVMPSEGGSLPEDLAFVDENGNEVAFNSLKGQVVLVNLWATWCPTCRAEMEVFEQAQQAYPHVRFVMLNQGESKAEVAAFIEAEGYQFDNLWLDMEGRMGHWFGQSALPVTLVFNKEGKLLNGRMGAMSAATLEQLLTQGSGLSLPTHF